MKHLKEIVGPVFDIYAIELLGSMSIDEAWRHLRTLHFYPEYIDLPGVCIQKSWLISLRWEVPIMRPVKIRPSGTQNGLSF